MIRHSEALDRTIPNATLINAAVIEKWLLVRRCGFHSGYGRNSSTYFGSPSNSTPRRCQRKKQLLAMPHWLASAAQMHLYVAAHQEFLVQDVLSHLSPVRQPNQTGNSENALHLCVMYAKYRFCTHPLPAYGAVQPSLWWYIHR